MACLLYSLVAWHVNNMILLTWLVYYIVWSHGFFILCSVPFWSHSVFIICSVPTFCRMAGLTYVAHSTASYWSHRTIMRQISQMLHLSDNGPSLVGGF